MNNAKEKKVGKRLVIVLDEEIHQELKVSAAQKGLTLKTIISDLIKKWLEKNAGG